MTHYFAPGCKPFAPESVVEQSEAEEIIAVRSSEAEAEVITSGLLVASGCTWRGRYQLVATGESWQIGKIEVECVFCKGTGKANEGDCELCKGNGWSLVGAR